MKFSLAGRRRGFTMMELAGVLILITIMVMLLLPAVQSAREMARRTSCANNLLQLTLGMTMYHGTYEQLPVQLSGTDGSTTPGMDNDQRLSVFVAILPFVGQPEVVEAIASPLAYSTAGTDYDEFRGTGNDDFGADAEDDFGGDTEDSGFGSVPDQASDLHHDGVWPPGGPEPHEESYGPWRLEIAPYRCPSDPGEGAAAIGRINYAACLGDGLLAADSGPMKSVNGILVMDEELRRQTLAAMRGPLVPRMITRLSDISDGLGNTILLGEIATDLGDRSFRTHPMVASIGNELRDHPNWARQNGTLDPGLPGYWPEVSVAMTIDADPRIRRGFRWADGMPLYTAIHTILPPNREIMLAADRDDTWGVLPPSSRHQGGAHVALADGSIRFITDSIDAGDESTASVYLGSSSPPGSQSPYGLWGAMGTRNSSELISVPEMAD